LRQGVHPASVAKVLQGGPFQWRSLVYVGCGVVRLTPPLRAPFATIFCPTHATRALSGADVAEASPGGRDVCRERRESREVRLRGWLRHGSGTTRTLSANTKADCARANMATDAKVCMTIGGSVRSPCRKLRRHRLAHKKNQKPQLPSPRSPSTSFPLLSFSPAAEALEGSGELWGTAGDSEGVWKAVES